MTSRELEKEIADIVADLGPVIGPRIVKLVRLEVQRERGTSEDVADPEVPHWKWHFCTSRRQACQIARSGAIEGARKEGAGRGTVWLARRSALNNYLERHAVRALGARKGAPPNDAAEPTIDDVHRELGLERVPGQTRKRRS